jgi:glyoxylase-like metal-dependent hydrolase (beta-lactamase superfamily II)
MQTNFYRFSLGAFECVCLLDGFYEYPLQNMYANVPREQLEAALRERGLPVEVITTPYTYLYVDTGRNRVLVDVGAGDLGPGTGNLVNALREARIEPGDIDTVIISHAHPDHIGGMLDDQGRPIYQNARYLIWKEEWDFWFSSTAAEKLPELFTRIARKNLEPVKERITFIDDECEVLPGIRLFYAPGHTPGHVTVGLHSGDERLMYTADTVLQPLHLEHPDWLPIYDLLPEKAAQSKQRIFDLAADQHYLVLGQHFQPFPSLGKVTRQAKGWRWEPVARKETIGR